ncbi:50s ribosomal protein l17 [Venturia nashicola]|uniref:50s ribosomal protein l17 n=1 Tax=Venturia nashicola TaxID=86259 RepID=A0A4Z1PV58_9PEZI|nr:50s ribosomal protein l17 [Venturia nashicola]
MATTTSHPPCPLVEAMKKNATPEKLYDTMVIVKVGPSEKEFHIHKGLICHYSEFFRGAFKGGFQENEGAVTLDEDRVDVFQCFSNWLYTGKLLAEDQKFDLEKAGDSKHLLGIYVFAEARGIPRLKNEIVNHVLSSVVNQKCIPINHIRYVYENTPEKDKMRALLVDIMTRWSTVDVNDFFNDETRNTYPSEFLFDACKATIGLTNVKKPDVSAKGWKKLNKCDYHDHTDINAPQEPKPLTPAPTDNSTP